MNSLEYGKNGFDSNQTCLNQIWQEDLDLDDKVGSKKSIKRLFKSDLCQNFSPGWFNCLSFEAV